MDSIARGGNICRPIVALAPATKRNAARTPESSSRSSFWLWPIAQRFFANCSARFFDQKIEFTSGGIFPHLAIPLVIHVQQPAQQFFPLIHRKRTGCFFDLVHRAHAEIVVTLILNRNIKRGSTIWNEISDVVRAQIDLRVIRDVWIVIVCASIQPDDRNADSCKNEYAIRNAERSRYRIRAHAT